MRKLRTAVVILFILSLIATGAYVVTDRLTADTAPPVLTSDEESISVSVEAEDEELMAGLHAEDNRDGDITDEIRIASMSHFTEKGTRTATYAVFDSANQAATLTRELVYTDYTSPQIHLSAPLRFALDEMSETDLTAGMSVEDCLDGDIASQIRVTYENNTYVSGAGTYSVTAQVSNSAGDTCSVPLEVTVTDPDDDLERDKYYPVLNTYIVYTKAGEALDLNAYVTGVERNGMEYPFDEEGTIADRSRLAIGGEIDYNTPGAYMAEYIYTSPDETAAVTKLAVIVEE